MITAYLAQKILDHMTGDATFTPPATYYVALYTDAACTTEVTGGSYARQVVTFLNYASGTTIQSDVTVTFGGMPACTVSGAALLDASTAGNKLFTKDMSGSPITVAAGGSVVSNAGQLTMGFA